MRQIIPSRIWRRASHPLGKAAALDPRKDLRSLHSCAEQPDRQDFAKSSLPACPVLLRCRSARNLFLPDFLRRTASSWCALVVAALLRKSIVACSRSCCCQGTVWFCKKLWTFQNAKGFVSESSPYTLYKLKGVFLNGVLWKFGNFSLFQTTSYTYNILKRVFGNLIFKFCLESFLHQYESIGPFWNTILKISQFRAKRKTAKFAMKLCRSWTRL